VWEEGGTHPIDKEHLRVGAKKMKKQLLVAAGIACFMLTLWACSKAPETYYPLGEGRTWKYQMSLKTGFGETQGVALTVSNLASRELKGKKVTPQKFEAQAQGQPHTFFEYVAEDANGIYTFAEQDADDVEPKIKSVPEYDLRNPLKVGNAWNTTLDLGGGRSVPAKATIASIDEVVDVPAGTFNGCVKVQIIGTVKEATGPQAYNWYAPSVGLVKSIEPAGSLQLQSFTK
jgi:hypothetical protein